jgi:sulfite reductase alpha subunit-like flavoprotein
VTPDEFNQIAWHSFITWAWSEPQMRKQFTAATGIEIRSAKTPIDAAIDAATGARESLAAQFIEWATREHWGVEHAPAAYRAAITGKRKAKKGKI